MKVTITNDEGLVLKTFWVLMDDAPVKRSTDVDWVEEMFLEDPLCIMTFNGRADYVAARDFQDD